MSPATAIEASKVRVPEGVYVNSRVALDVLKASEITLESLVKAGRVLCRKVGPGYRRYDLATLLVVADESTETAESRAVAV